MPEAWAVIDAAVAAAAAADPPAAAFTADLLKRVHRVLLLSSYRDAPAMAGAFRTRGVSSSSTGVVFGPPDGLEPAVDRFFAKFAQRQRRLAIGKDPGAAFSLSATMMAGVKYPNPPSPPLYPIASRKAKRLVRARVCVCMVISCSLIGAYVNIGAAICSYSASDRSWSIATNLAVAVCHWNAGRPSRTPPTARSPPCTPPMVDPRAAPVRRRQRPGRHRPRKLHAS